MRTVTLTRTGPDRIVIELTVSAPSDCAGRALAGPLDSAIEHALDAFATAHPVDVDLDDTWLTVRVLREGDASPEG